MVSSTTIPPPTAWRMRRRFWSICLARPWASCPRSSGAGWTTAIRGKALLSYALNNEAHQQGFFSRNLVREIIYSLISARDESGELEQQLQDATLSQEERETKAEELYQVWDNELNEVWDALNRLLSPEDMEALTAEELEWIAWKEEQAALAGAGMDGTLRAAELTRERVGVLEEYLGTL